MTWSVVAAPAHGVVEVLNPLTGAFQYLPEPGGFSDAVFRFSVTDGAATTTAAITLHINRVNHRPSCVAGRDIAISDAPVPFSANGWIGGFSAGSPYESGQQVLCYVVSTDHPEVFFLPPALSRTGTLTFIPAGNLDSTTVVTIAITVQDDGGTDFGWTDVGTPVTATLTLTVSPPAPVITSATTVVGTVGVAFSYQITGSNSPTTFNATGLPAGLSVDGSGLISGTPTAAGGTTFIISATNAGGTGSATLTVTVAAASGGSGGGPSGGGGSGGGCGAGAGAIGMLLAAALAGLGLRNRRRR